MDNEKDLKIQKLLDKLLEPNFEITEVQLDLLAQHLPELYSDEAFQEDCFLSWFKKFSDQWKTSQQSISTKAILVTANVIGTVCSEEQLFLSCNFTGLIDEFLHIIRSLPEIHVVPYTQLHYIRLLTHFLKHKTGLVWLVATNSWYDILTITLKKTDEVVFKGGCTFLVELLDKSKDDNEVFHKSVIKLLLDPLIHFSKNPIVTDENYLFARIRLNILETIFREMLDKSCTVRDFKFIQIMQDVFKVEVILEELTTKGQLNDLYLQLNKLLTLVIYFILAKDLKEQKINGCDKTAQLNYFSAKVYEIILKAATSLQGYSAILELLHEGHMCYKQVVKSLVGCQIDTTEFQCQMLPFIFFPIFKEYIVINGNVSCERDDEVREEVFTNLFRRYLPNTLTTVVKIKRREYTTQDALACFSHIQNCTRFYEHNMVITIAQIIIYTFGDILEFLMKSTDPLSETAQQFISALLETIIYLFTEFDLSWKDSVETTYVGKNVATLLICPNLTNKIITRGLQLLNVAIRKKLSPELYLLVDEVPPGKVQFVKTHLFGYLSHTSWEIRNAAVQVVHARAQTKKDFSSTSVVMLTMEVPDKVLDMLLSDSEITVRISALRCLRDILNINELWNHLSNSPEFYDKIMQMFYLESDGVLRSETLGLITTIYELHIVPDDILGKFYDIMSYAVLEDQFALVKINALCFWKKVIDKYLDEEGMIDGEFPSFTFSKKQKKIITFDAYTIKKCLGAILQKLSEIDCLTIFLFALNCQIEHVEETALQIIKPFMELLKKHYFVVTNDQSPRRSLIGSPFSTPRASAGDSAYSTSSSNLFSPYPESLYNDILDMEESLTGDQDIIQEILQDTDMENLEEKKLGEFVTFVENFDFSQHGKTEFNDVNILLNNILG